MYFYDIKVDRVTAAQIAAAKEIIPSLEMRPTDNVYEALESALQTVAANLDRYEYVDRKREMIVLPKGEVRSPKERRYANFIRETDKGWVVSLVVAGD